MPVSVYDSHSSPSISNSIRDSLASTSTNSSDDYNLHSQLEASAKHILLTKIDYEEINNFKSSQDTLKSKYIVLKPKNNNANKSSLTEKDNKPNGDTGTQSQSPKDARIPEPKRILFPKENVQLGWKSSGRKWKIGSGMLNVGNTCYLNSTLQALFHVPAVANWLIADAQHKDKCQSSDGCIICVMIDTLIDSQKNEGPIKPWMVYSRLRVICRHLVPGRQEDAHEFLRYLVEAMEKSYLLRYKNSKEFDQYSKETTPLNQIFGGYLRSAVKCLACNHISTTFQHFEDILLDIRKSNTIDEALDCYFSRERLEDMGYKCESCKKKVSATKQFYLERAPPVICIQLKRFSVVGGKLNKHVVIRTKLDLSQYAFKKINETLSYKLVSMVTHLGASQHCGHYTAIGLTDVGGYYQFDDSCVRPIAVQNVINTNAYILFYELEDALPSYQNNNNNSTITKEMTIINENGSTSTSSSAATTYNGKDATSSSTNFINQSRNTNTIIKTESNSGFIGPQLPLHLQQSSSKLVTTSSSSTATTNGDSKKLHILTDVNRKINLSNNHNNNNKIHNGNNIILNGKNCNDTINSTSKLVNNSTNNQNSPNKIPNINNPMPSTSNAIHMNGTNKNISAKLIKNGATITTTKNANISPIHINGNGVKKWIPVPISNLLKETNDDKNSLPSMPKLMEETITTTATTLKQNISDKMHSKVDTNEQKIIANNNKNIIQNGHNKPLDGFNKPKSLVPYDSNDDSEDSDEDDNNNNNSNVNSNNKINNHNKNNIHIISNNHNNNDNNNNNDKDDDDEGSSDDEIGIVETKTGPWQVSEVIIPSPSLHVKTTICSVKKKNNNKHKKNGNHKYEHANDTVNQLLEMGQKTNITTWNGQKSNLEKEIIVEDKRVERKRLHEEDNENEMDRGRVKKVKIHGPNNGGRDNPGFNPFQETQLQQNRRWVNGRFYNHTIYKQNHHRNQNFQQRHRYSGFNNNHRGHQREFNR